jgi:hypothetical protein
MTADGKRVQSLALNPANGSIGSLSGGFSRGLSHDQIGDDRIRLSQM